MSLNFHSDQEAGLTTISGEGPITWDCLHQILRDLLDAEETNASLPHIIDLRETELDFSTNMDHFGEFFALRFGTEVTGSIAIVIKDGLDPDVSAMFYKVASSVDHTELFDDYNHAMRWLMRREFANAPAARVAP